MTTTINPRPHLFPVLIPGDIVLIMQPIFVGYRTGVFMKHTNSGTIIRHFPHTYAQDFWYPRKSYTLLARDPKNHLVRRHAVTQLISPGEDDPND